MLTCVSPRLTVALAKAILSVATAINCRVPCLALCSIVKSAILVRCAGMVILFLSCIQSDTPRKWLNLDASYEQDATIDVVQINHENAHVLTTQKFRVMPCRCSMTDG